MNERSDHQYFEWLRSMVSVDNPNPGRTHTLLLEVLHTTPFYWYVPNDDNRSCDGIELQIEFYGHDLGDNPSTLEVFIALARRLSFETDVDVDIWFWHLMENLELTKYNDNDFVEGDARDIRHILETVINREYAYNGKGGLFPLANATEDQRLVEIWYQMSSYLLEGNGPTS